METRGSILNSAELRRRWTMTSRRASATIPATWTVGRNYVRNIGILDDLQEAHTQETNHLELELSERGNADTHDNDEHICQSLHVRSHHAESPSGNQSRDDVRSLF